MNRTNQVVAALATILLLAIIPSALGDNYPAGTTVAKGDADHTPWPSSQHTKVALCGIDLDGSTTYGPGEPLYINIDSTACDQVGPKDIRLSAFEGLKAGKEVKHEDLDRGLPTLAVAHKIRFIDMVGKGKFEAGNGLYIDVLQTGDLMVGNGDLRLVAINGQMAFTAVRPGDRDAGMPYSELAVGGVDMNTDSVIYKAGSAYYVNVDAGKIDDKDHGVEDNDVRLIDKAAMATGGNAAFGTPGLTVTGLAVSPETPFANTPIRVSMTISNDDDVTGSGIVETTIDGTIVDSRGSATLAPGENTTMVLTLVAPTGDSFTLGAGEETLTVAMAPAARSAQEIVSQPAVVQQEKPAVVEGGSETIEATAAPVAPFLLLLVGVALLAVRRRL